MKYFNDFNKKACADSIAAAAPVMYELLIDILDELRRATRDAIETGNREGSSLPVKLERRIYETLEKVEGKKA